MSERRGPIGRVLRQVAAMIVALPLAADAFAGSLPATGGAAVVTARPIVDFHPSEPGRRRFGDLEFLGGLVLSSSESAFQSLSALVSRDSGRTLVSVTDEGTWVGLRLDTDEAGRPLGVAAVDVAPLLDAAGKPFPTKWARDAESLAFRPTPTGGELLVGFEGHHRVLAYTVTGDARSAFHAPGRPVAGAPREIASLRGNRGLEGLAVAPPNTPLAGALLLLAEEPRPGEADQPAWIVGGPRPGLAHLARRDHYAVTDAAFLPTGDLLVLQRRFGVRIGLGMRLVRIAAADVRPGRAVEGRVLLEADWGWEIDNMEGLAVDTAPDGSTILTLVSDDNGNWFQRTVLLRFRLHDRRP
ncbi:MAG: esterase-like activity of phytase family protein [Siculibacillus sp.]|nr:esterase-like activity of phytase family protein [Siculibacillus sp.]